MRAIVSILVYEVKAFRQVDQWIGAGDSFRARTGVDPRYGKPSLVPLLSMRRQPLNQRWMSLIPPNLTVIQICLDHFAIWHNLFRPHASLDMLTHSEAELGLRRPEPIRYTQGGVLEPKITIKRQHVGDDPRWLYAVIKVKPKHRSVA